MSLLHLGVATAVATASTALVIGVAPQASASVHTPPDSITADCSVDVSAELRDFFASVPDGGTAQLRSDGCYRVEREIRLPVRTDWTLDGGGATLRRTTLAPPELQYPNGANAMLRSVNLTDSVIQNLNIVGINTVSDVRRPGYGSWISAYGKEHGLALLGARNVIVRDVSVDAVFGDGVYVSDSDEHGPSRNVRLTDLLIDRNGRQGIGLTSVDGLVIDNVTIAHSRRAGIDMEPHPGKEVRNVTVQNSSLASWLMAVSAGGVGKVSDIHLRDNTFRRSALPMVWNRAKSDAAAQRRSNWLLEDNQVTFTVRSSAPMFLFTNTEGVGIKGTRAALTLGSGLVARLGFSTHASLTCNQFDGAIPQYVVTDSTSSYSVADNSRTSAAPVCTGSAPTTVTNPAAAEPTPTATPTKSPAKTKPRLIRPKAKAFAKCKRLSGPKGKRVCKRMARRTANVCDDRSRLHCKKVVRASVKKCRTLNYKKQVRVCKRATHTAKRLTWRLHRLQARNAAYQPPAHQGLFDGMGSPGGAAVVVVTWVLLFATARRIIAIPTRR